MKRFSPHGHGEARQQVGGEHTVVAAAEHRRLAVPAAGQPLGLVQPLLVGHRVQLRRVLHPRLVEQAGVVPEHGVLGEVLRHAVAGPPALGAAVVAPQVVDRVEVGRLEDTAPREVRVKVLHHAPGREVRGVHGADPAHEVRRVAVGHHRDQLAGAVQHRVDPDADVLLGLLDQVHGDVVGLGHHRDGLAGSAHRARHPHRAAAQRRSPRRCTAAWRGRENGGGSARPRHVGARRTTSCSVRGRERGKRMATGCCVGAELRPCPETASRGLTDFRKDCVTSPTRS